jgi:hypothetical protein
MYYLATLHPQLKKRNRYGYFSRREMERQVLDFYHNKEYVPICIDHCGASTAGFVVPREERVGAVEDLFINQRGQMMVKMKLDPTHGEYPRLCQSLDNPAHHWGVSVWIDQIAPGNKKLTHVALTDDPYFAQDNTFVHAGTSIGTRPMDRIIHEKYYSEGEGLCFASKELKEKLYCMFPFSGANLSTCTYLILLHTTPHHTHSHFH